jgi:hypothetical protein
MTQSVTHAESCRCQRRNFLQYPRVKGIFSCPYRRSHNLKKSSDLIELLGFASIPDNFIRPLCPYLCPRL